MENIILSFNVIAPLFFLMVIGYVIANYTALADKSLLKKANSLVFKVFLPCMLFRNIYQSNIREQMQGGLCFFAAGSLLLLFVLLCLIVPRVVKKENQQGVVIQGIFRSNYVIFGVAVVENMYGSANTVTAAILSAVLVPMYNFLAVIALSFFGGKRERDFKKVLVGILKNPLIIASVLGIIASLLGVKLPQAADTTLNDLAKLATPIAFLILGGDFDFSKVRGNLKIAGAVVAVKMVILPLIFIPMVVAMGYRDSDLLAALLAYQTPVAVSSYVMAQQAEADEQLAGQLVVFSSVVSIFTLFVTILILRQMGLLS
ncbi:AEC family transporter [Faecalicatena sp. AGMB00832]|uniref:AEC family transporter n=1 Tax=Faecalicatena faecalis TaxID=2726362 RepID=A0ABS6D818_9FIRM|nr:AEC family transporter [Faecalicatena faecalis]MBU3877740.1 AEC family transporter [Faecalicatena faecalis]